jgi:Rieske Fe-S protein
MTEPFSRRSLLHGAIVTGVAAVAGYVVASNSRAAKTPNGPTAANAYGPSSSGGGELLATVSQIPPGGGIVLEVHRIVLTRDASGVVHGFSAVCTHQGCTVGSVQQGQIICPCHGSRFSAQSGSVLRGPATAALPTVAITIRNGGVYHT